MSGNRRILFTSIHCPHVRTQYIISEIIRKKTSTKTLLFPTVTDSLDSESKFRNFVFCLFYFQVTVWKLMPLVNCLNDFLPSTTSTFSIDGDRKESFGGAHISLYARGPKSNRLIHLISEKASPFVMIDFHQCHISALRGSDSSESISLTYCPADHPCCRRFGSLVLPYPTEPTDGISVEYSCRKSSVSQFLGGKETVLATLAHAQSAPSTSYQN